MEGTNTANRLTAVCLESRLERELDLEGRESAMTAREWRVREAEVAVAQVRYLTSRRYTCDLSTALSDI